MRNGGWSAGSSLTCYIDNLCFVADLIVFLVLFALSILLMASLTVVVGSIWGSSLIWSSKQ